MPRSVAEIQAEIAKVKQEIATRDMYRQPQSRVGWASYVGTGDRGLLDSYQNREDQYNKMIKQQQFQAAEAALARKFQEAEAEKNRQNALEIADKNNLKNNSTSTINSQKVQLEADLAQAEYDDAIAKVDIDKPETILAAKKAALKLNYANSNLPYFDKEVHIVPTEFSEDAPGIAKTKKANKAIEFLDSMDGVDVKRWTNEEREEYTNQYNILKEINPELAKKYQNKIASKGATSEERNEATKTAISNAISQNNPALLPKGYAKKSFDGKPYLAKKDANGKWTKVQEWK